MVVGKSIKAASTVFSLIVLILVLVFGVIGLWIHSATISSVQAEAVRAVVNAAEAGREKLYVYIWKNVTETGNVSMVTLENRGGISLTVERAVAVGYSGDVVQDIALSKPITIGVGQQLTLRLDRILPGYTFYEDTKSRIKTIYFKTVRGNVFGSTYSVPEKFEQSYATTISSPGTTITLTMTSGETFTPPAEMTITTITNVTVVQGVPMWDAEIYIVLALRMQDYSYSVGTVPHAFSKDVYTPPDWLLREDLKRSGKDWLAVPRHVACWLHIYILSYNKWFMGRWEGISEIDPKPTWVVGERKSYESLCSGYYFPVYDSRYGYLCMTASTGNPMYYNPCFNEAFIPNTSIPAGNITIKAPQEIVFSLYLGRPWSIDYSYYIKRYYKLQYYIFYDAYNMSRVILSGNKTVDYLYVDRPIKGGFVYVLERTEVKLPPPPRPKTYYVWLPNICFSPDTAGMIIGGITGDEKTRTVTIDFSSCPSCDAYVAPGPGEYDPSEVPKCEKSGGVATCHVPIGSTVIIDANPEQ